MRTDAPVDERNLDGYKAPLIQWGRVRASLEEGLAHQAPETGGPDRHTPWLATVNPDGTPHVMPVGVMLWVNWLTVSPEDPSPTRARRGPAPTPR
jgi:hypothetical protein